MLHIFKYKIICMLHDKQGLFWMIAFPFAMLILFWLAFSNLSSNENEQPFDKTDVAIVNASSNADFITAAESADLFNITDTDMASAEQLLSDGKITAIIDLTDGVKLTFADNGIYQSVVKIFTDTYLQNTEAITGIIMKDPALLTSGFLDNLSFDNEYTEEIPVSESNNMVIYFYALLAMTAIMGGTLSNETISSIQANQSETAKRASVAPANKMKMFVASISATIIFHFISTFAAFLFADFVLGVDFGNNIGFIALILFVGSFTGIMIGALVCAAIKKRENFKVCVLIALSIFSAFLSGMMSVELKYAISSSMPIISRINPASLVTDALYSLYYYGSNQLYLTNVITLAAMGIVAAIATVLILRRQKYASL